MDLGTLANAVNAVAVAAAQISDYRRQRRREAMLELVRSFQSPDFTRALRRMNSLPDGASRATIRSQLGSDGEDDMFLLGMTWESLGVLLFRREVTLDVMDDLFAGAIVLSWRKLHAFVEEDRHDMQRETVWEWFQWLAERILAHERAAPPTPAHIAYKDWK